MYIYVCKGVSKDSKLQYNNAEIMRNNVETVKGNFSSETGRYLRISTTTRDSGQVHLAAFPLVTEYYSDRGPIETCKPVSGNVAGMQMFRLSANDCQFACVSNVMMIKAFFESHLLNMGVLCTQSATRL